VIKNVPLASQQVIKLAEFICPLMETLYGKFFDVKSEEKPINIAYTNVSIPFHIDLQYYESPPGFESFHREYFLFILLFSSISFLFYFSSFLLLFFFSFNFIVELFHITGIQYLHCLQFDESVKGGESIFVDAFACAEKLRIQHPNAFRILSTLPTTFQVFF
jgi:hypothetical protein